MVQVAQIAIRHIDSMEVTIQSRLAHSELYQDASVLTVKAII